MTRAIAHRGPDDEAIYQDGSISLGVRRLCIIDVEGGKQPIYNEKRDILVVFNGEIYNFKELRKELQKKGHRFATGADTEVIVHLYEEKGINCLNDLRGMFAFAVYDRKKRRIFLARDRLGVKPLYYVQKNNFFAFASELRSFLAGNVISRSLDFEAVRRYLGFPCVPAPLSIFKEARSFMPGEYMVLGEKGIIEKEIYWDVCFNAVSQNGELDEQEVFRRTRRLLEESVRLRMISDVPLGAFLSGGIDSSSIVGLMGRNAVRPVQTYSIAFTGKEKEFSEFNELSYAKQVAESIGSDHTEVVVSGKDVHDRLMRVIWAMDQPSGDAVQYYLVSEAASKGVTVALSGTGGDEVFAGYEWFKELRFLERLSRIYHVAPEKVRRILEKLYFKLPNGCARRRIFRKINTFLKGEMSFEERYRLNRRLFASEDIRSFATEKLTEDFRNLDETDLKDEISLFADRVNSYDVVNKVSYLQLKTDLPNLLIRDTDVVGMSHSLEIRVPLIDHRLVEYVAGLPGDLKLRKGSEKFLLRKSMEDVLPPDITSRRKKGFVFPMHLWMRNELSGIVLEALSKKSVEKRGWFRYEFIRSLRERFFQGREPFFKVWNFVVLELWARLVLDHGCWEEPTGKIEDLF